MTYSWHGLTQTYKIHLPYDGSEAEPAVLLLVTANPPTDEPAPANQEAETASSAHADTTSTPMPGMGGGGMGGGGMGPGAGGGQRPDVMASDADGDGKVSREEAPERLAEFFERIDTNGDGFIDAAEAAARRQRGGGGRPPGESADEGNPRNRPPAEDAVVEAPVDAASPANTAAESSNP